MKKHAVLVAVALCGLWGCRQENTQAEPVSAESKATELTGQSGVQDESSAPNIVKVAADSKDHTTLVAAVKAAGLVDALSNAGPFTVFAPTNAAFDKLPPGTVDDLLKPENKESLTDVLGYHTYVGVLKTEYMQDGQEFEQVSGKKIKITKSGDKVMVNGSEIMASIPTSNGIIHVINDVLQAK